MNPRRPQAVFLDRDGVLNQAVVRRGKPYPPATVEDMVILPGVLEGLTQLRAAGFLLVGATNQPDVARGIQQRDVVEAMHARLMAELPLDDIYVCYEDHPECPGRKPNPGLLLDAAQRYGLDLASSFMVGDRWRDVGAGQGAGCRTVFLDYGYAEQRPDPPADHVTHDFTGAVQWILAQQRTRGARQ